jgi:RNA polymerase sigma-70 factor (ECF subfamily)
MTDIFAAYERGLAELMKRMGKDHPRYTETLTLQSRLRENLNDVRECGDYENRRAGRAHILKSLNRLAMDVIGVSFNVLCRGGDQTDLSVIEDRLEQKNKRTSLVGRHRCELLALLKSQYTLDGIKTLCFVLESEIPGIDYGSLLGEGLEGKARELIKAVERAGKLNMLLDLISEQRPDLRNEISGVRTVVNRKQLQDICQQVVKRKFMNEDWQLIDDMSTFIRAVFDKTLSILPDNCSERQAARAFEKTTKSLYYDVIAKILQEQATHQLDRAYKELYAYLYDAALYRVGSHDQAEKIAQEALVKVWAGIDRTLDARGFLVWAQTLITKEIIRLTDLQENTILQPNAAFGTVIEDAINFSPMLVSEDPEQVVLTEELRSNLVQMIKSELKSKKQQKVILLTFLEGKSSQEIADELDISASNVYVLRSRALQHLRACQGLRNLIRTWLEK